MTYQDCTISQFMNAWFNQDFSVIEKDQFVIIYSEYLDTSGLFLNEDFERQGYIQHLNSRINYVKIFVRLQREFISIFDVPFIRDFEFFKNKYGYFLLWKNDKEDFEAQLKKVEMRELKNESHLEIKLKELEDFRKNKGKDKVEKTNEKSLKESRISFIRMLNSLGKIGYIIDKNSTTIEELSIMIKQQLEESKS